jgi:hypothetical protein
MLGFSVSQATVSRYLPPLSRRPRQSWQTFVRNQSMALGRHQDQEVQSDTESLSLRIRSNRRWLMESVAQIAAVFVGPLAGHWPTAAHVGRSKNDLRSAQRHDNVTSRARRFASAPGGSRRTLYKVLAPLCRPEARRMKLGHRHGPRGALVRAPDQVLRSDRRVIGYRAARHPY